MEPSNIRMYPFWRSWAVWDLTSLLNFSRGLLAEKALVIDITVPILSPILARKKTLAEEIAALDVNKFECPVLPKKEGDEAAQRFRYEGYDIITLQKEIEREYTIPEPQTAEEVISYYAKAIANDVKLPSQFAALAPKVREFLETRAFGEKVDLSKSEMIKAIATSVAQYVTIKTFAHALRMLVIEELTPELRGGGRKISDTPPFPYSRPTFEAKKCVLNLVPCENKYEVEFARFLEKASDVTRFVKLPGPFGFAIEYTDSAGNLRYYEPDFVAVTTDGAHYLIETKGLEDVNVAFKDRAAGIWCENATLLTGTRWNYLKVLQKEFTKLQSSELSDLALVFAEA